MWVTEFQGWLNKFLIISLNYQKKPNGDSSDVITEPSKRAHKMAPSLSLSLSLSLSQKKKKNKKKKKKTNELCHREGKYYFSKFLENLRISFLKPVLCNTKIFTMFIRNSLILADAELIENNKWLGKTRASKWDL